MALFVSMVFIDVLLQNFLISLIRSYLVPYPIVLAFSPGLVRNLPGADYKNLLKTP